MKILKKFLIITMLAVLFFMMSSCGVYEYFETRRIEKSLKERVGETLRIDLTDSKLIDYWVNRNWFNGDGNELATFKLSENALLQFYALIEKQEAVDKTIWHALPFSEESYEIIYGGNWGYVDTRGEEDKNALPYVENGYWWCGDSGSGKVPTCANDFALFDADMGVLYYYEYDS